jgi:molybdate transport system substrate-binding protein
VWDAVAPRVVAAQDVRGALAWVAGGEAPAGIVYATDAASSPDVDVAVRVPPDLHPPVVYPLLVTKGAGDAARALRAFLLSDEARAAFEAAGFAPAPR